MAQEQGLSLDDIANLGEDVDVEEGKKTRVKGISARGCLNLLIRFPDLQKWLTGLSISISDIIAQTPDAVAAIIAAGMGRPGDNDAEELASNLPIELQTDILEAVYRRTFREGFGPFVVRLLRLYDAVVAASNRGEVLGTRSPLVSKPLSQPDIPPQSSGNTPPAK